MDPALYCKAPKKNDPQKHLRAVFSVQGTHTSIKRSGIFLWVGHTRTIHKLRESPLKRKVESGSEQGTEAGFSLMEIIVTLALLSLISTILFQSVVTQWSNMQRVSAAFDRAQSQPLRAALFRDVARELVPAWPNSPERVFNGDGAGFEGMTLRPLSAGNRKLTVIKVALENDSTPQRLVIDTGDGQQTLVEGIENGQFDYFGMDGQWHEAWPPKANPGNGFFQDQAFFQTPALPEAIRLRFQISGTLALWVVPLENRHRLPFRLEGSSASGELF